MDTVEVYLESIEVNERPQITPCRSAAAARARKHIQVRYLKFFLDVPVLLSSRNVLSDETQQYVYMLPCSIAES